MSTEGSQIKSLLGEGGDEEVAKKAGSKSRRRKPRSREAAEVEVEKSVKSKKSTREKVLKNVIPSIPNGTQVVASAETHNPSTDEATTKVSPNSSQERRRKDEVKTVRRSRRAKVAFPDEIPSPQDRINDNHTESAFSEARDHPPGGEGLKSRTSRKERKSKSDKAADSGCGRIAEQEGSKSATSVKERKYKVDKVGDPGDGSVAGQEQSVSVISRKGRKSKSDVASNQGDESAAQPEIKPKLRKSRKENLSSVGDNSAQISEEGSKTKKKKKKKSRKKIEEIMPAETCGTFGLSAMIEPWALLETVAKQHRDEVHVLKDIMDLQAARTGDRSKLHQLQKLLTRIDKRDIPTPTETSSASSEPIFFSPPLSVKNPF